MKNQNLEVGESSIEVVKERLKMLDDLIIKFSGFPDVQQTLKEAKESLLESEEEIMNYYDLTDLAKTKLN
tara:strand:- start:309 stop:518 length:210 start_codon:yes stop_codon:yes gene_type:complete